MNDIEALTTPWGRKIFSLILISQISRGQVMKLCSRLSIASVMDTDYSRDVLLLHEAIYTFKPLVSDEQFALGKRKLREIAWTPHHRVSKSEDARQFDSQDRDVVLAATRIELSDLWLVPRYNRGRDCFTPVYRISNCKGWWFEYINPSWQSGGRFQIVDRGFEQ